MSVVFDIVEGELLRNEQGTFQTRTHLVSGLSGDGPRRLANALEAVGVDDKEPHPFIPGAIALSTTVTLEGRDPGIARVTVQYGPPTPGEETPGGGGLGSRSYTSELVTEQTIEDINGKRMVTEYARSKSISGGFQTTLSTRTHRVDVDRPLFTIIIRRQEQALDERKIEDFTGTVNSRRFGSHAAKTLLCRITADQNANGLFDYSYIFTKKPETWRADVTSEVDGFIPADVTLRNGRRLYDVYPSKDFNRLGLRP